MTPHPDREGRFWLFAFAILCSLIAASFMGWMGGLNLFYQTLLGYTAGTVFVVWFLTRE